MSAFTSSAATMTPVEAVRRAEKALREFPSCFWTRSPAASLDSIDDVRLVIRRLRQNGGRAAWQAAREIEECL